jgi:hypothetical protein
LLVRRTVDQDHCVLTPATTARVAEVLKFTPTLRGCGSGYFQEYVMPDCRTMGEGSDFSLNARTT